MSAKYSDNELLAIVNDEWEATQTERNLATELLALRADAETSQNHNAGVIDRIVEQLREAGYTGTLSEMVDEVLETPDPRADLFCFKPDESGHWYCIPVEHVKEFESWVYNNNKEVNFEEYRLGSHISRYIFRNPVEA